MRTVFRRAASLLAATLLSSPAFAQNTVSVYVDSDASTATGCTVTLPGGTFSGADTRISVTVTPGATPSVGTPTQASCAGGTFSGGTPIGTSAVGLNTGAGGADVLEIGVPEGSVHTPITTFTPVGFTATNAQGSDVLFPTGAGIVFGGATPLAVPVLTWLGGALLLVAVVLIARRAIRRSRLLLLSLFAFAGLAWAAGFVVDGQVGDWAGETLYTDPLGDPTNGQASIDIATGGAEAEGTQAFFRIDIRDLQNQPPVASPQVVAATEDTPVTITLSGSDAEGSPLTFAIASAATRGTLSGITQLTPTTARVTYTPNPNTNGADSFSFTVNDGQINSLPATVTINVAAVNDAPVVAPATFPVVEDSAAGTDVGTATATDVDTGQTVAWAITAGNTGNAFSINPATGLIEVLTPGAISTPGTTFSLTVQATDNGTPPLSGSATITINVTGINDPPSFTAGPNQTVAEDAGPQTVNPWATGISPGPADEAGQTVTFEITANTNTALFSAGPAVSPTGVLTYTPTANASGTATITLRLRDNGGTAGGGVDTSPTQQFTITVTPVNDAPVVTPSGAAANFMEGGAAVVADPNITVADIDSASLAGATVAITANFQSGADVLAFTAAGTITGSYNAATGVLTLTGAGTLAHYQAVLRSVTFSNGSQTPTTAARTLTWTATDGTATSAPATSQVTINNVDTPPTAVADAATVAEDAPATAVAVLANDTDPDAGPISIASVTQPANGVVVITGGGTGLTYQPNANFCSPVFMPRPGDTQGFPPGPDSFTYTLAPGGSSATVSVTVTCVDDAPVAVADVATVGEDSGANAVDVLANDTDADGGPRTILSVTQPANGSVAITGGGTGLTYQPTTNYCNSPPGTTPDTFTYTLSPGGSTATVSVTVACADDPPTAVADAATVGEDSSPNTLLVLANDTDVDGGPIAIASVTQPANGVVVITGGGASLTYTPAANYCNSVSGVPDTFTYTLSPGGSTATVSVTVPCGDDPPVAVNDAATVVQGSGPNAIPVLANDTDNDGGPIAIGAVTQPANGAVVITGGGTGLTYQPNAGYCNNPPGTTPDTFTYSLNPGGSTATVSVTVTCDAPPTAVADSATVAEDSGATAIAVLANDTDADGGPRSVASVTQPANGTVVITGGGTGLTYQPGANYCNSPPGTTPDTFTYTLAPGGSTATVSVTVTCTDDAPVAVADAATVVEDSGANAVDVLANDTDVDGGARSITSVTQPANGTVVITGGGTGVTYAPNANYCNSPPGTALDTFTYTLTPGGSSTTVTVTVTCVDDAPVANPQSVTMDEDTAAVITLTGSDPEASALTFSIGTLPANGTLSTVTQVSATSASITYTPAANANGADNFTFTVADGSTTSPSATVSITVTAVDDPPVAVADSATVLEDSGASAIAVLANDTDIDAGPITVSAVTQPANGTVVITGGGTGLTYAPNLNYCNAPPGTALDTFTYTLAPGGSSTTVTMTVTCVNDAPVADDESFSGAQRAIGNTALVGNDPGDGAPDPTGPQKTITGSILAGDTDVDGPGPLTVTPGTFATNDGGSVVIEADGDFTFFPAAGTSCTDTSDFFDYTVEDSGSPEMTDVGRVTIAIADCVWYVDSSLGVNGSGRSHEPFNVLTNINGAGGVGDADGTGHILFLYDGSYSGGLPLEASQSLFAQRHGLVVPDGGAGTVTLEPAGGGNTTIGGGLVLGLNNTVQGIDLGNHTAAALSGTTVGTATINTLTSGAINNATNGAISINGGTLDAVFATLSSSGGTSAVNLQNVAGTVTGQAGTLTGASGAVVSLSGGTSNFTFSGTINDDQGQLVRISGETGGLKAFTGAVTDGDDGDGGVAGEGSVHLVGNAGATIRFSGGLLLNTGGNAAFNATGGGTIEVCDEQPCNAAATGAAVNTLTTSTGVPLNVLNTTIGTNRLEFRSIAANGAPSGIVLDNTGAGGLVVKGNSAGLCGGQVTVNPVGTPAGVTAPNAADCSGGTIQNTTASAVILTTAANVSLTRMRLVNSASDSIRMNTVNGFALNNSNITDAAGVAQDRGIEVGDFSTGTTVNGTVTIANSTISPTPHDGIGIGIGSGTSTWSITGTVIAGSATNSGINFELRNNATVTSFLLDDSSITGHFADGMQMQPAGGTTGAFTATLRDTTFANNNIALDLNHDGTGTATYTVLNNTFRTQQSHAMNVFSSAVQAPATGGVFNARISGNRIGDAGTAGSGSAIGNGIRVNINGGASGRVLLDGNVIRQTPNGRGIEAIGRNGTGGLDITVTNNDVNPQDTSGFPLAAIFVQSNAVTVPNTVRSNVTGNTVPVGATADLLPTYIALVESGGSTLQLVDTGAPDATCTDQLTANNTGSASASAGCALISGPINTPP